MNLLVILHDFSTAKTTRTQEQKHTFQFSFTVPKRILSKIMVLAGFGLLEDY
jgi:hypothetical protein